MVGIKGPAGRRVASLACFTLASMLVASNAWATHVAPVFVSGNPSCIDFFPNEPDVVELKIDSPTDGTFTKDGFSVTIDVRSTPLGTVFDFVANTPVDAVFAKGGPNGNLYVYDPPETSDTGLHAPVNPSNGRFFGLSHISFCFVPRPSISVTKVADTDLSKVGDSLQYTIHVTNDGSATVFKQSIIDDVLGDLTASGVYDPATPGVGTVNSTCGASLAVGATCTITVAYTVQPGDSDPLVNVVTATYNTAADFSGTLVSDLDDHVLNLFQPNFTLDKTGDALSKIGDQVTYTFTLTNTSSADSPNLLLVSISDDKLGNLAAQATAAGCDVLTQAEVCAFSVNHVIPPGAGDPYVNTVTATYNVSGFPNLLTRSDTHNTNLFQPDFTIAKTGDALSKIGDQVTYTFTLTNTSSADSPNLSLVSISDDKLGSLVAQATAAGCDVLTQGEVCVFAVNHVIPAGASDPYVNTVTATYGVAGFPNQITHADNHTTNLFQPSVQVVKSGPAVGSVGQTIDYTFTITNTSSADSPSLVLDSVTDVGTGWPGLGDLTATAAAAGCGSLVPGASCGFSVPYTILDTDPTPLINTVTVLYHPAGFPNVISDSDDHLLEIVGEGCTPGFWRQPQHLDSWAATGYAPGDSFEAIFGRDAYAGSPTLLEAVKFKGGGLNALGRHAAAALLNAAHPDVDFALTEAQVISLFQNAFDSGSHALALAALSTANEAGCPIS